MRILFLALIRFYQIVLSPYFGGCCRFHPTCSEYAREAIEVHGCLAGTGLALWRLARCHPLCRGGCDPVPAPVSRNLRSRPAPLSTNRSD